MLYVSKEQHSTNPSAVHPTSTGPSHGASAGPVNNLGSAPAADDDTGSTWTPIRTLYCGKVIAVPATPPSKDIRALGHIMQMHLSITFALGVQAN